MEKKRREKKAKRILLIAGSAVVAGVILFLSYSHQKGKAEGNDRRHFLSWNKEVDLISDASEETLLSVPKRDTVEKQKLYLGMEGLHEVLGDERYQTFQERFEKTLEDIGASDCNTVMLALPDITADAEQVSCYLQTDDADQSLYQFIFRYLDESYNFVIIDALPDTEINPSPSELKKDQTEPGSASDTDQKKTEPKSDNTENENADQAGQGGNADTPKATEKTGENNQTATGSAEAANATAEKQYRTVNDVQFENDAIYDVLSEKAVDLFTKDVTAHWSSIGEDRRLIRTTTPQKNGSKVIFTCTFPDGGDSFTVTLDLNTETFSYGS